LVSDIQHAFDSPILIKSEVIDRLRVRPGKSFRLKDHDPGWTHVNEFEKLNESDRKEQAQAILKSSQAELADAQELLWADNR
jgi:hypothetical protein